MGLKQSFRKCISLVIALGIMSSAIPAYATNSDVCVDGGVHNLQYKEAKKPTWTEPGYEAYEYCSNTNCEYNTYVAIPALGEPEIEAYDEFIENLGLLEEIACMYTAENPGSDPLELIIKYIRTGVDRYNSGSWGIMAGYENADFASYVRVLENSMNAETESIDEYLKVTALKNINNFELPNGDIVDFGHMFGTMDIAYTNKNSENHADVGGWAGDLVDLMSCSDSHTVTGTVEEMVKVISDNYLLGNCDHSDTFGRTDMYGDLDAYYIISEIKKLDQGYEMGYLTELIASYFTEELTEADRAEYLLKNRLGNVGTREQVRRAVYNEYTSNKVVTTLESTREFLTDSENINKLRRASCYAFADYICQLAGDYIEIENNPYYEDFNYETSSLAPGVTYEKHYATTADGKQIVYYTATADLSNENVTVYANYNKNDPTQGWAMSRVMDQANAAQSKYGNPESEQYIENYQVVAAINADGYDMKTGEPGGLLVMNGIEHHAPNSAGFFGITKEGKAVIGTTAEYNSTYKGQLRDAVGAFGVTLVKEGKINIAQTPDYYNDRASRTAIGITKTGKVVFMVLDGRQEPFSCGGSMQEIAQIMLEAGCYNAINLDGGGSTTFVTKPEGKTELEVTSSPSDGYARSVSTSLMMVSTTPSSTKFDHARLDSNYSYATIGTPVKITPVGLSATGNVVELPQEYTWKIAGNDRWASITEDGVFTALQEMSFVIQLLDGENNIIGQTEIEGVSPDNVYFKRKSLDLVYGSKTDIPVAITYLGKDVAMSPDNVELSVEPESAGTFDGLCFTAAQTSLKSAQIKATLKDNQDVYSTMSVNLYNQGDNTFDFDKAIGGDRQFAWDRKVSNSTTDDAISYTAINSDEDMVTSYIFAIDMQEIPIPARLSDLVYMLPGADADGDGAVDFDVSAWNFLLQLAERISVLTEVKPVLKFDERFDVDYKDIEIINDYFYLDKTELDEEKNELTLTLKWRDQTAAIKPENANPLCMLKGIKLTPKREIWNDSSKINAIQSGHVGYTIYLRASALYSFSQKAENQQIYGLKPFENPDVIVGGSTEKGGYFADIYKKFEDHYTLSNSLKNGWINEEGGFAYYINGERLTGIKNADGYYYDFGEDGINVGQQKYTGLFEDNGKTYYAKVGELMKSSWQLVGKDMYHCHDDGVAHTTSHIETYTCVKGGYVQYTCSTCKNNKYSNYIYPAGHEWDADYKCIICDTVGKDINDITIGFGTIDDPRQSDSMPYYSYEADGAVYPKTYATYDGKNELTWSNGASLNEDGTIRDLYVTWTNAEGIGEAYVNFRGKGDYYGERSLKYYILTPRVEKITATSTTNSITLSWNCIYNKTNRICVYDYTSGTRKYLGDATGNTFKVNNLSPDTEYKFSIRAYAPRTDGVGGNQVSNYAEFSARTAEMPEISHYISDVSAVGNDYNVKLIKKNDINYIMMPSHSNLNSFKFKFIADSTLNDLSGEISGDKGKVTFVTKTGENNCDINLDDLATLSNNSYTVNVKIGNYKGIELRFMQGENIPSMFINSSDVNKGRNFVDSVKGNEATGNMTLISASGNAIYNGALTQIKARGNSTFAYYDKKAYQIKLDKSSDLLGNGENVKTWVLLANYGDATLMHDKLMKDMAIQMRIKYTASSNWVNVWYDGEYRGVYLLSEKNSVSSTSVDITDLEESYEEENPTYGESHTIETGYNKYGFEFLYTDELVDPADITGGYLIELNHDYIDEANGFKTRKGKGFNIKSPEWISEEGMKYISEYYQEFEDAVYATDDDGNYTGYNKTTGKYFYEYVDIDSLIRMVMLHSIGENSDGFISSVYFNKDSNDIMNIGPVWDQDMTFGTGWARYNPSDAESYKHRYLVEALLQIPLFKDKLSNYYNTTAKSIIQGTYEDNGIIDEHYNTLSQNAEMNYALWPYVRIGKPTVAGHIWNDANYNAVINDIKSWIKNRVEYLDEALMPRYKLGDVNSDGNVNGSDVLAVINYILKGTVYEAPIAAGDVNSDGNINGSDVLAIINYVLKGTEF